MFLGMYSGFILSIVWFIFKHKICVNWNWCRIYFETQKLLVNLTNYYKETLVTHWIKHDIFKWETWNGIFFNTLKSNFFTMYDSACKPWNTEMKYGK